MQKLLSANITREKNVNAEEVQAFLIFDAGYSILLFLAFHYAYWDAFFGGLAGILFVNLAIFIEYYLKRKKKGLENI